MQQSNSMATDRIGLVGVGRMGHGIAKNVLKCGFPLTYLRHPGNQPVADLDELGAAGADNLNALAEDSTVIILCVTGSAEVAEVLLGEDGLSEQVRPGQVVVDCSTIQPQVSRRVATQLARRQVQYLDAPMTRTPREAEQGRLNLLVGGDTVVLDRVRPILEAFAERIDYAGPTSAGHTLKLLHNFISLGNCALLAEAVVCADRGGVDRRALVGALAAGGGASIALTRLTPYIVDGDDSGFAFTLGNCHKDLGYYAEMAEALGASSSAARAIQELFGLARGTADQQSVPHLIELLAKLGKSNAAMPKPEGGA